MIQRVRGSTATRIRAPSARKKAWAPTWFSSSPTPKSPAIPTPNALDTRSARTAASPAARLQSPSDEAAKATVSGKVTKQPMTARFRVGTMGSSPRVATRTAATSRLSRAPGTDSAGDQERVWVTSRRDAPAPEDVSEAEGDAEDVPHDVDAGERFRPPSRPGDPSGEHHGQDRPADPRHAATPAHPRAARSGCRLSVGPEMQCNSHESETTPPLNVLGILTRRERVANTPRPAPAQPSPRGES